jgi:hypothetical protein
VGVGMRYVNAKVGKNRGRTNISERIMMCNKESDADSDAKYDSSKGIS